MQHHITKREAANADAVAEKKAKARCAFAFFLCFEFVSCFCKYMRTTVDYLVSDLCRSCPLYCVFDYSLNVRVIVRKACFMTGLEIEYLAGSAQEAASASEDVSVFIPSSENKCIGLRNIEGLAVKLFLFDNEMIGNSRGNRVRGHHIPDYLLLLASPGKITRCSDNTLEYL